MQLIEYMNVLGRLVVDKVTGVEGICMSVNFELPGCIQCDVRPRGLDEKGELKKGYWFDYHRLEILNPELVITLPVWAVSADEPQHVRGGLEHTSTRA